MSYPVIINQGHFITNMAIHCARLDCRFNATENQFSVSIFSKGEIKFDGSVGGIICGMWN